MIHKTGRQLQGSGNIQWDVFINKNKSVISGGLVVVDKLSENQTYLPDSLMLYETKVKMENGSVVTDKDGNPVIEVDLDKPIMDNNLMTYVNQNLKVEVEGSQEVITVNFPDNYALNKKTIAIRFEAAYIKKTGAKANEKVRNEASINYYSLGYEDYTTDDEWTLPWSEGEGFIYADTYETYKFNIFKYDATNPNNKNGLEGAIFNVKAGDSNYTFISDENGMAKNDKFIARKGQTITIVETTPPPGYSRNTEYAHPGKTIKLGDEHLGGIGYQVEIGNDLVKPVVINKKIMNYKGSEDRYNKLVDGLEFDLYEKVEQIFIDENTCGEAVWTQINDKNEPLISENGEIKVSKLTEGRVYRLVERENDNTMVNTHGYHFTVRADKYGNLTLISLNAEYYTTKKDTCKEFALKDVKTVTKVKDFENYMGEITINKIDSVDKELGLAGATFEIHKYNDRNQLELYGTYATPDGKTSVTVSDLEPGKYVIKEIKAPTYYKLSQKEIPFTIEHTFTKLDVNDDESYKKVINLVEDFENELMSELEIDKKIVNINNKNDDQSYAEFKGNATFDLGVIENNTCNLTDSKEVTYNPTTKKINLGRLEVGYYCLSEKSSTDSVLNTSVYRFEVKYNETTFENEIAKNKGIVDPFLNFLGNVKLIKTDDETSTPMANVKFTLHHANGEQIKNPDDAVDGKYTTNQYGEIVINDLKPGDYYFVETDYPAEYVPHGNINFTIAASVNPNNTESIKLINPEVKVENYKYNPGIIFKKGAKYTKEGMQEVNPKATYSFLVSKQNSSNNCTEDYVMEDGSPKVFTNDATGKIILDGVTAGNYCLHELTDEQYIPENTEFAINTDPLKFNVIADKVGGKDVFTVTTEGNKNHLNKPGKVEFTKKDKKGNVITTGLAKAKFDLYRVVDGDEDRRIEKDLGLNTSGKLSVTNLAPGKYYFVETSAPEFYITDGTPVDFEIPYTYSESTSVGTLTKSVEKKNELMPKLKLNKKIVGIENKDTKEDAKEFNRTAEFNIYKVNSNDQCGNTPVTTAKTERDSVININEHLTPGFYCLKETRTTRAILNQTPMRFEVYLDTTDNTYKIRRENNMLPIFYNYTGRVELTKYAKEGEKNTILPNAKFELYYRSGNSGNYQILENSESSDGKYTTDEFGKIEVTGLNPGQYYFKETDAPEGFRESLGRINFEIAREVDLNSKESIAKVDVKKEAFNYPYNKVKLDKKGIIVKENNKEKSTSLGAGYKFNISVYKNNECSNEYIMKDDEKLVVETNANGEIEMTLGAGKYCLEEIEVNLEDGYILNTTKLEFEIAKRNNSGNNGPAYELYVMDSSKTKFYNFKGSVELTKQAIVEGNETTYLQGAEYKLFKTATEVGKDDEQIINPLTANGTFTTNENGKIVVHNLAVGNYYFVEVKAPDHHILDETPVKFEISRRASSIDAAKATVTHDNTRMNELEIKKVGYIDDNYSEALDGAKFNLFKCNDEECNDSTKLNEQDLVSENGGVIKLGNLLVGKYFLQETDANTVNTGYHINETKLFFNVVNDKESGHNVIEKQDGKEVIFENYKPKIQVFKYEIIGHDENGQPITMPLQGAEFGLFAYDGPKEEYGEIYKDANGNEVIDWTKVQNRLIDEKHFENNAPVQTLKVADDLGKYTSDYVEQGWYYIFETKAPDYYSQVMIPQLFPNKIDGQAINSKELIIDPEYRVIKMMNERFADAAHQIKKLDEDNKPVANAEFDLYNKDGNKKVNGTFKSNENGIIALGSLAPGHYYLKETKAGNAKYMLNTDQLDFEVVKDGTNGDFINGGENVKFINYQGKQKINKVDNNNRPLKGAKFDLFTKAGKKVKSIDMSSKSTLTIDKLAPGEYYLVETKASKGFAKSEKHHNFTIPEKHAGAMDNDYINSKALTITNDKEEDTENKKKTQDEEKDKDGMGTTNYGTPTSGSMLLGLAGILGMIGIGSYAVRKRFND